MYTIDLMDVIVFFVLLFVFAFFGLLLETALVGGKNNKVNDIEENMKVKKYGGKYRSGVREVNTAGENTIEDVQRKILDSKTSEKIKTEIELYYYKSSNVFYMDLTESEFLFLKSVSERANEKEFAMCLPCMYVKACVGKEGEIEDGME